MTNYKDFLKFIKLHTAHSRILYLDAMFFFLICLLRSKTSVSWEYYCYSCSFCNFRSPFLFTATCNNSAYARCILAANVCKDIDIFRNTTTSFKQILLYLWYYCIKLCFFGIWGFFPSTFFCCFSYPIFCLFSVLCLSVYTAFVFYMCLCAGFTIDTCTLAC